LVKVKVLTNLVLNLFMRPIAGQFLIEQTKQSNLYFSL
jgi:hypothetical protein